MENANFRFGSSGGRPVAYFLILLLLISAHSLHAQKANTDSADEERIAKNMEGVNRHAQQTIESYNKNPMHYPGLIPGFFEKQTAKGSPYFSSAWMKGAAEMGGGSMIPKRSEILYFNFDKMYNKLFVTDGQGKIWSYAPKQINSFVLADSGHTYLFEKIPFINNNFFVQPVVKPEQGYSLYKRVITRVVAASYRNDGYYVTGEKFDQYKDFDEYYLIYPDGNSYEKFFLKENDLRKALKDETQILDEYVKGTLTEQTLVSIVNALNTRKTKKM